MPSFSARDGLTIPEALHDLRTQLLAAVEWADDEQLTFAIDAVEVELQMTVSLVTKGDAKVSLWTVVTAGGGADHTDSQVHRVKLTLQPGMRSDNGNTSPVDDPRLRVTDVERRP
ncbi:trypco2 family protein [Micromonospora sp. NPDC051141]|uniref:trypco2 family protein n=1 Tax=Micromonospora sp. NPDC051141 TaxID=3364284 RepID=UPI0037AA17A8